MADRRISEIASVEATSTELRHGDHLLIERSGSNFAAQIPERWAKTQVPADAVYDADLEAWADTANPTTLVPVAKLPAGILRRIGDYAAGTTYAQDNIVKEGTNLYISLVDNNLGNTPSSSPTQWSIITGMGGGGGGGSGDDAYDWATEGNDSVLIPDAKIPASIARDSEIPTDAQINALADARVAAGVADWAEDGNSDLIPSAKLPPVQGSGDDAFAWATEGNTDPVPDAKLSGVQPVALVSNQARWGTNKLPTNVVYNNTSYSASATYNPGVEVQHNGHTWKVVASTAVTGSEPADDNSDWVRLGGGTGGSGGQVVRARTVLGTTTGVNADHFLMDATGWESYEELDISWKETEGISGTVNPHITVRTEDLMNVRFAAADNPGIDLGAVTPQGYSISDGFFIFEVEGIADESDRHFYLFRAIVSNTAHPVLDPDHLIIRRAIDTETTGPDRFTITGINYTSLSEAVGDDAYDWATEGNTDVIPDAKLPTILTEAQVDARVTAGVADWAEDGNTDLIPSAKLPPVQAGGDDAFAWATEGNTDTIPDAKIPAAITRDTEVADAAKTGNAAKWPVTKLADEVLTTSEVASQALAGNTVAWPQAKMAPSVFINRGNWTATNIYQINHVVRHSDADWVSLVSNNQNSEPSDSNTNWRKFAGVGPAGPKGDKGDTGDAGADGDDGADGAPGAQGPAGPAGTVPNQPGVPIPHLLLGSTNLAPNAANALLTATGWQNFDLIHIVIREAGAVGTRRHNITGSYIPKDLLNLTVAADDSNFGTMSNSEVVMYRGETTGQNNAFFYVARTATEQANRIRWSANRSINPTSQTQTALVYGTRVGYASYKGVWTASVTYARGDYVWHDSEFWFVTAETISNSEPSDTNTNYKKLGSGGGGADSDNYRNALRPATNTTLTNVRTATVGVHKVGASTQHLPSGFVAVPNETSLVVWGTDIGNSSEHKVKMLAAVNKDAGASAAIRQLYFQLQDGPGAQAASHSPWFRVDNSINAPQIAFDSDNNEIDLTWTNADGSAGAAAAVAIPAKYRGRVETVTMSQPSFGVIRATMLDADGTELGNSDATIAWPGHTRSQWVDGSRTTATIISPQELGRFLADAAPVAAAPQETSEANTISYRWTPQRVGNRAKSALPVITAESLSSGTNSTVQKTVVESVLKAHIENAVNAGGSGGSGGGGGRTLIGTLQGSSNLNGSTTTAFLYAVNATGWADYDRLEIGFDSKENESDTGYKSYPSFEVRVESLQATDVYTPYNPTEGLVAQIRVGFGLNPILSAQYGSGTPLILQVNQVTEAESSPWEVAEDKIGVWIQHAGIGIRRIRVWGINDSGGGGAAAASGDRIAYAHANAPSQDAYYTLPTLYGETTGGRVTDTKRERKFVVGDILSSSNDNLGLPTATLAFATGSRSGEDNHEGETAAGNLLDGTVFTPGSGTWRIAVDLTMDNIEQASQRMIMRLYEVVATGTDDDKLLWSEASEAGGAVGQNHSATTPTSVDLHNFAITARMETPPLQFDGATKLYVTWQLTGTDDDQAVRVRNAALSLVKEA